jgi:hypothetical protein
MPLSIERLVEFEDFVAQPGLVVVNFVATWECASRALMKSSAVIPTVALSASELHFKIACLVNQPFCL